jgi:1,4-alpha-glucan branching enzyme
MIALAKTYRLFERGEPRLWHDHGENKVIAFERAGLVFVFNFHPATSHFGYCIDTPPGKYRLILDSDRPDYGGHGRLAADQDHFTLFEAAEGGGRNLLSLYLPVRTAIVLKRYNAKDPLPDVGRRSP